MILSDKVALSWLPEKFESDEEMVEAIQEMHKNLKGTLIDNAENNLRDLLLNMGKYDLAHIYIANDLGLRDISQSIFGQYDVYTSALKQALRNEYAPTTDECQNLELYDERINKLFKSRTSFSIAELNSLADCDHTIENHFKQLGAAERNGKQEIDLFSQIETAYAKASDILSGKHGNIGQSEVETALVKNLLDAYKSLQHFIKPLLGHGDEAEKDNEFDAKLRAAWDALDIINPLYNKVRNWLTRKPYSTEKIKLNFENAQLLDGWDKNKETVNTSVLLRKDGMYYLAIMNKKANDAFACDELPSDGDCYEKIDYKQISKAKMNLPHGFFPPKNIDKYAPSEEIKDIYSKRTYRKGKNFNLEHCRRLIDFFKRSFTKHKDWKNFQFIFSPTEKYECISSFYNEVEQQAYMLDFRKVSVAYINQLVEKLNYYVDKQKDEEEVGGLLHAFQLTSKLNSFKELGKQSGCLFYVPAWNTSKIDPVTGFVNLFDTKNVKGEKVRAFFSNFDAIRYNAEKDWFEFAFNYSNFTDKAKDTREEWTLCTHGTSIRTFRNPSKLDHWDSEEVVLTDEFKKVFEKAGIDICGNLKNAICALKEKAHLEKLMQLMKLLLQMRNSKPKTEVDYMISPVADEQGNFYDSRCGNSALPDNADANGAYNIARKGLWVIKQIRETPAGKRPDWAIKNKEWLKFAQQKPYLDD